MNSQFTIIYQQRIRTLIVEYIFFFSTTLLSTVRFPALKGNFFTQNSIFHHFFSVYVCVSVCTSFFFVQHFLLVNSLQFVVITITHSTFYFSLWFFFFVSFTLSFILFNILSIFFRSHTLMEKYCFCNAC